MKNKSCLNDGCDLSGIILRLEEVRISYKEDYLLKFSTYFKTGGKASLYISPDSVEKLKITIRMLHEQNVSYKVIGFTSNVFFLDELDYGVIVTTKNLEFLTVDNGVIDVECGYPIQDLVRIALINGRKGFEGLEGIPGSIGGAVIMNAGAYGYDVSDNLVSVECIDSQGNVKILSKDQCQFKYRSSVFKHRPDLVVLSAKFNLKSGNKRQIASRIEVFHIARHLYQDFSYPNLGSLFSINGDIYRVFFRGDKKYYLTCLFLKAIYKNRVVKFFMRKRPNNIIFNKLAKIYEKLDGGGYEMSPKSMNILVNNGETSLSGFLEYITAIQKKLDKNTLIENEIVIYPIVNKNKESSELVMKVRSMGLAK